MAQGNIRSLKEIEKMAKKERIIPIFYLASFVSLFDWIIAIKRFFTNQNAGMVRKLRIEKLKHSLAKTRDEIGRGLREFITSLDKFSQNILTCQVPGFKSNIERILNAIPKAEKELR